MIPNSYRILKLRSGEQLICEIKNSSKDMMKVKRPMAFRSAISFDGMGNQKEYTVLRDWLNHTNEIETGIPRDFIVSILVPDEKISGMYDREKEREDEETVIRDMPSSGFDSLKSFLQNEVNETLKDLDEEEENKNDLMDEQQELMVFSLALPMEALKKMIENDILNLSDLKDALESQKPSGEGMSEKHTPDGDGTDWTDWSPFVEDYLSDDEDDEDTDE
jgi:hypothetical protein